MPRNPTPAPTPDPTPTPTPTDPAPPTPAPADPVDDFTDDRQRQRFSDLTTRLQEREAERDTARQHLEAAQWREALALAGATLAQPDDLRLQTPALADLLTEGQVDPAKVAAAAQALVTARPGMRRPTTPTPLPGGGMPPPPAARPTLADVIRRASGGRV